jgi:phosphate transport system permease protein
LGDRVSAVEQLSSATGTPRSINVNPTGSDRVYRRAALGAAMLTLLILFLIGLFLLLKALPAFKLAGSGFFTRTQWPSEFGATSKFGIAAILFGTIEIAFIALVFAVPVSMCTAIFIVEYAPLRLRRPLTSLIDLLAAIPSLIFGLWGYFFLQPRMLGLGQWLNAHLGFIPLFKVDTANPTAINFFSSPFVAGTVVSLMVVPICTSVMREVFSQAPPSEKEGALALGATRWGMVKAVTLPFGRGGIIGGAMLGLGRALGETIAIAIIISPVFVISPHILQTGGNSIAAFIALRFSESSGLALSALMAAGLTLFLLTLLVNVVATFVVNRSRSGSGVEI